MKIVLLRALSGQDDGVAEDVERVCEGVLIAGGVLGVDLYDFLFCPIPQGRTGSVGVV